jgi:hypothetical protein
MDDTIKNSGEEGLSNVTVSFGISLAVASVASALMVVAKEKSPALMASMKSATGHHWSAHSLFALAIFLVVGFALTRVNGGKGVQMTSAGLVRTVVGGVLIGSVIIGGFYLFLD